MSDASGPVGAERRDRLTGALLFAAVALEIAGEWGGGRPCHLAAGGAIVLCLILMTPRTGASRKAFVATGIVLIAIAVATRGDWMVLVEKALRGASFVPAFFLALASLRNAATTSPAIERCGRFLANQPAGRRYLALTMGGHLFGIALSYGAIALLGSLAERGAQGEPDATARAIRVKRMLLAIQRGFLAMTTWSPLTFSIAITTSIIAGSSWNGAVAGCLVSAAVLLVLGWVFDVAMARRRGATLPPPVPEGSWATVTPLAILLAVLIAGVGIVQVATGLRAVAVVMVVVPAISLGWIAVQNAGRRGGALAPTLTRGVKYFVVDAPNYRSELVLLIMAAVIGTMASGLMAPFVSAGGLDLSAIPGVAVLVALVWLMPLTGQLAMNPILAIYLIAPLLPQAEALGVDPNAIIVALTAGWALSGVSSPYTASTLLVAALGKVTAFDAGPRWNGLYTLAGCVLLSVWVAIYASI